MLRHIRSRLSCLTRRWFYGLPVVIVAMWLILLNRLAPPPHSMNGAEPSAIDRSRIMGTDDRVLVADPTTLPWRMVGQVRAWWGNLGYTGTGVFVGPDQVLTAAHCVYRADLGGWADRATFTPARGTRTEPFGTVSIVRYAVPRGYAQNQNEAHDVVLVTLEKPLGNETGWMNVISGAAGYDVTQATLRSAGYPAEKSNSMYTVSGSITATPSNPENAWEINLDATFGQSGSPIWVLSPSDGQPMVVAVLVAELDNGRANLAAPVTTELLDQLRGNEPTNLSIAQTAGDTAVVVAEPGSSDSPLVASPITACGAGIAPMMVLSIAGLAVMRSGRARGGPYSLRVR